MHEESRHVLGHALDVLATLPDRWAHCCVTSPPYLWKRRYGAEVDWPAVAYRRMVGGGQVEVPAMRCELGHERSPDHYVGHLVAVFRHVRRILRDDGTMWLNLDSSAASGGRGGGGAYMAERAAWQASAGGARGWRSAPPGYTRKDVVPVPWLVGLALQADGWVLRPEVVWAKTNAQPESPRDRPSRAHELVLLLSKGERYHYDRDAVRRPPSGRRKRRPGRGSMRAQAEIRPRGNMEDVDDHDRWYDPRGPLLRSVWSMAVSRYRGPQFATFPEELPRRCILAGCPPGGWVIDPFLGSGTTARVAEALGRRWLGVEVQAGYEPLILDRTRHQVGLPI